jgi:tetratricopeptide (TPR) repeat protein
MTKALGSTLVVLLLVSGVALIGYARWTGALADADAAFADGRLEQAVAGYQIAEGRFDALPAAKQIVPIEYTRAVGNHLLALYRLKRYDEVIDLAQKVPAAASPNFWSACAFFQKASVEEAPEARLGWLSRAEEEFRKALEAAPEDWDAKYDFELTTRLASALRKQPNTPPKQLMQLLRPPTAGAKPPRRTG